MENKKQLVQKKQKRLEHPEGEEKERKNLVDYIYDDSAVSAIFDKAIAKLSTSEYEILGTEQIVASILEDSDSDLAKILAKYNITSQTFDEELKNISSRTSEYDSKKIVFTPKAFVAMNMALQTAKELGSSKVLPEHLVLGILKSQKGVAYDIFKRFRVNDDDLISSIIKPIEKQMPEALVIMKLAKEEARRIGRKIVGTEMLLLGIIAESTGVGATVLNKLEITLQDTRKLVESQLSYGNDYFDTEIVFTKRAKAVLEKAWNLAKQANKERIRYISKQPNDDLSMGCRVGIMNFFSNIPSTVADVSMIMSFILFIIIIFTEHNNSYLSYVLLFILILSLNMHGLFNGRIYKTIKIKHKRREKHL